MSSHKLRIALSLPLCALLLALTCTLKAQTTSGASPSEAPPDAGQPGGPPHGGPPSPAQELQRLAATLQLSDAQKTEILPILEKRHAAMEALMHSGSDRSTTGQEIHQLMDSTNQEIRALLTEEQQKIFDNMRPPRPPQNGGNSSEGSNGPPS